MFADFSLESVTFKSNWKKERSLASSGCQTTDLVLEEVGCQSVKYKNAKTQTEDDSDKFAGFAQDRSGRLVEFLQQVEPIVRKQLEMNIKSHAFDDYEVTWDEGSSTMSAVHKLTNAAHEGQFQITSLSWNSTGAVIAASYGRFDHDDWCTHKTSLCTWNLERRNLNENKPDTTLEVSSCLMCTTFHPTNPALIAGGTYNGVVIVWDLSREDDMVLTSSGLGDDSHREPVSKVTWVPDTSSAKKNKYLLVSVSSDGKMLVWKMDRKTKQIELHDGFILMNMNLPRQLGKARNMRRDKEVGVTCISYNAENKDSFVIGSEPGAVFKCSMSAQGELAGNGSETYRITDGNVISSVQLKSPVTFTYAHHYGPVYSAEFSPFHRNAFLTCSMDQTLRLYSMLQKQPIMTIEPGEGVIYSVKWSFSRPSLFAATTDTGLLLLYDLNQTQPVPVYKLEAGGQTGNTKASILTCQFNPHQHNLIATGDSAGCIQVFRISDSLKTSSSRDLEVLSDLVDITSDN
ncbi:cytoplasmic dynein 2 intermediate chain 2-like isoform X1 [Ostrea edulis]|uniref:cytoplasmic dynein 2 intermediate chain 2-like isoform X1 n=1 Tax=Ostrea edulis TaxID=37623 RepID=UPI0020952640|nr:cytoplasmic dynein 2 intermediate chain 2-like isoform X1 [Ostrea edulis]